MTEPEGQLLEAELAGRVDPGAVLNWTLTVVSLAVGTPLTILLWNVVAGL